MATVDTASGRIEGAEERGVLVFKGVPYAQPPVGELRFRAPRPAEPWAGVRPAVELGAWAPQNPPATTLSGQAPGPWSEDCLTLNVWTASTGGSRPVMVWVHGGGFTGGSGSAPLYDGAALARRGDVVVVTVNYRLGALGFLAHPVLADDEAGGAAGNWGLLDQVAALRWVRDNIGSFGGDPANVTLFGESAGGMSVADLMAMPSAAGLFHKAIVQSGPPNAASMDAAADRTAKLLAELGLSEPADLRGVPVEALLEAQTGVLAPRGGGGLVLVPVVDGASLPADPLEAIAGGSAADVPLLIGTNRDEAKMFMVADPRNREPDEDVLYRRIERAFAANGVDLSPAAVIDAYRRARTEAGLPADPREVWSAIESDRMFRIGSIRTAEGHAAHQPATFMYLFEWESPAMRGALGACHALELPFVFGTLESPGMPRFAGSGPEAERLSAAMMDAWASFARDGHPAGEGLPGWPAYDARRRATMVLGASPRVEDAPLDAERAVWEKG
jgi:para-nitrobenzyl esterase